MRLWVDDVRPAPDGYFWAKSVDQAKRMILETGRNYPVHIHSMNPVGVENMRRVIHRNGWREV